MKNICIGSILFLLSLNINAGSKKQVSNAKEILPEINSSVIPYNDNEFYKKKLEEVKSAERKPAQAKQDGQSYSEPDFEADFKDLRAELIGGKDSKNKQHTPISTTIDLHRLIEKYSNPANYNNLTPAAKMIALQLRALRPFRGIVFRAREFVGANPVTRSLIVSLLNTQLAGIQALFPVSGNSQINQWEVMFHYITAPTNYSGVPNQDDRLELNYKITEDYQLHQVYAEIAEELNTVNRDFLSLITQVGSSGVWWDNKLYMSFANFSSRQDRFIKLGTAELNAMYSASALALSSLYSTTAYEFHGLKSVIGEMSAFFGIGIFGNSKGYEILDKFFSYDAIKKEMEYKSIPPEKFEAKGADGINSFVRTGLLNAHPQLFMIVLQNGYGRSAMAKAYELLVASARAAKIAFEATKLQSNNGSEDSFLFDSRVAQAFDRTGTLSIDNINKLVSGLVEVRDLNNKVDCNGAKSSIMTDQDSPQSALINSEIIRMDIKKLYCDPPKHLNELYAVDWDTTRKTIPVTAWGQPEKLRNYKYGMATKWNYGAYHKIFPDINPLQETVTRMGVRIQVTDEVPKHARILMQTWGGAAFLLPIGAIIF